MSTASTAPFAAVLYDEGAAGDLFLAGMAGKLRGLGYRLAGVVQSNEEYDTLCACDMTLAELSSGTEIRISQRLGRYARGCRLDAARLAEAAGLAEAGFDAGADLVILNKFGKSETHGSGFLPLLVKAVDAGVPVLVGLNRLNLDGWRAFTGGEGALLSASESEVMGWLSALRLPLRASA